MCEFPEDFPGGWVAPKGRDECGALGGCQESEGKLGKLEACVLVKFGVIGIVEDPGQKIQGAGVVFLSRGRGGFEEVEVGLILSVGEFLAMSCEEQGDVGRRGGWRWEGKVLVSFRTRGIREKDGLDVRKREGFANLGAGEAEGDGFRFGAGRVAGEIVCPARLNVRSPGLMQEVEERGERMAGVG